MQSCRTADYTGLSAAVKCFTQRVDGSRVGNVEKTTTKALSEEIKAKARALGFDAVGIAKAEPADPDGHLARWLERGFAADMDYMSRTANERSDPSKLVENASSVIALSISYYHPESEKEAPETGKVSRYARSDDYHKVIRKKIRKLRKFILTLVPEARIHPAVDTSPVLERHWAEKAGIAWIGKSTMAISQSLGTYTFLATLITDLELTPDTAHVDRCGSCTACLDACPPKAFVAPYQLDSNKCITYWNVEHRKPLQDNTPDFAGWVAGCDICQEVCPWNKFAKASTEERFIPRPDLVSPDLLRLSQDPDYAEELIKGTSLQRTGVESMQANAKHVMSEKKK